MKNPYAKRLAREYRRFFLRVILLDYPRLRKQRRNAEQRGESIEAINAEADQLGQELKKKYQLYKAARDADKMLSRARWQ